MADVSLTREEQKLLKGNQITDLEDIPDIALQVGLHIRIVEQIAENVAVENDLRIGTPPNTFIHFHELFWFSRTMAGTGRSGFIIGPAVPPTRT